MRRSMIDSATIYQCCMYEQLAGAGGNKRGRTLSPN